MANISVFADPHAITQAFSDITANIIASVQGGSQLTDIELFKISSALSISADTSIYTNMMRSFSSKHYQITIGEGSVTVEVVSDYAAPPVGAEFVTQLTENGMDFYIYVASGQTDTLRDHTMNEWNLTLGGMCLTNYENNLFWQATSNIASQWDPAVVPLDVGTVRNILSIPSVEPQIVNKPTLVEPSEPEYGRRGLEFGYEKYMFYLLFADNASKLTNTVQIICNNISTNPQNVYAGVSVSADAHVGMMFLNWDMFKDALSGSQAAADLSGGYTYELTWQQAY
jgi:hypothetical protein